MFDSITVSIAYLRSKALEWYEWLQQFEGLVPVELPAASADTPVTEASTTPLTLSAPTPQQVHDETIVRATPDNTPMIGTPKAEPAKSMMMPAPTPSQIRDLNALKKVAPVIQPRPVQKATGTIAPKRATVQHAPIAYDTFSSRGKDLEYLIRQTRKEIRLRFFARLIVGFTGRGPQIPSDIEALIRRLDGIPGFDGLWQNQQLMIVGRENVDTAYLKHTVQAGMRHGFTCHFISQEALTGLLQFGTLPGYYLGDARIREHAGLSCVANFGFVWPSTNVSATSEHTSVEGQGVWRQHHELVKVYDYRVDARTGLTIAQRQDRLRRAVVGLGLRGVAEHIAANIQLAKNRRQANMESAIDKWEDDMDWLYDTFYRNSIHSFIWPAIYRRRRKAS